ncbi:hypothetical protein [Nocardia rhizosphaerae]|uniref:Uncharacterized protein n=1 Tax=Nocardia rhizosphaerae TaxID=1691571 RepID=A0ABV8L8W7_9NOCA
MSNTPVEPRGLTGIESDIVTKLLSACGAGVGEYLLQIPYAEVVATWGPGSPSVDLVVRPGAPQAAGSANGILANGAVTDPNGSPVGELILWVENGWLSGIEYAWYTDERPQSLPDPAQVEVL